MRGQFLVNVGFSNYVLAARVIAVVNPGSSPMRRLREDARTEGRLVDVTQGRKTRSIVVTDSNHVILSAVSVETLGQRFQQMTNLRPDPAGRDDGGENPVPEVEDEC